MKSSLRPLCFLCFLLTLPVPALAQSGNPYLDAGVRLYGDLEYEAALDQLTKASSFAGNTPSIEVQIATYRGVIRFELGDKPGAETDFKTALAFDPNARLPEGVSPKIREVFEQARAQIIASAPPKPAVPATLAPPPPLPPVTPPPVVVAQPRIDQPKQQTASVTPSVTKQPEPQPSPAATVAVTEPAASLRQADLTVASLPSPDAAAQALGTEPVPATVVAPASKGSRILAGVLLGAGAALGGSGAFFGYQSSRSVDEARAAHFQSDGADALDRGKEQALAANVLYGAATAAVIGGFVALFAD